MVSETLTGNQYLPHLLPKAELGSGLPQLIKLLFVTTQYERVVDDKQRMCRHVLRECDCGGKTRHCE